MPLQPLVLVSVNITPPHSKTQWPRYQHPSASTLNNNMLMMSTVKSPSLLPLTPPKTYKQMSIQTHRTSLPLMKKTLLPMIPILLISLNPATTTLELNLIPTVRNPCLSPHMPSLFKLILTTTFQTSLPHTQPSRLTQPTSPSLQPTLLRFPHLLELLSPRLETHTRVSKWLPKTMMLTKILLPPKEMLVTVMNRANDLSKRAIQVNETLLYIYNIKKGD